MSKQIKRRKQEIKDDFLQQSVDSINAFIEDQSEAFQGLSHSNHNDKEIFTDAISGKASTKGMQKAITRTYESIKAAITEKAAMVDANAAILKKLPPNHQPLFQDNKQLLDLPNDDLNTTIDERIATFEHGTKNSVEAESEPEAVGVLEESASDESEAQSENSDKSAHIVTIEITASEQDADDIRTAVVKALAGNGAVGNITFAAQ